MDLEQVIVDSVNDSVNDVEVEQTEVDTPSESVEASESVSETEEVSTPEESSEIPSPAVQEAPEAKPEEPQDEFAKLAGVPQMGVGGRENRIPYSRVKKITEKAVSEVAEAALGRKLNPGEKALDVVKSHVAQIPELTAKVTDYEDRLTKVGQFEDILANDPQQFLTYLAKLPAYKGFFEFLEKANEVMNGQPQQQQVDSNPQVVDELGEMPQPDMENGEYSLGQLQKLMDWNVARAEAKSRAAYEAKLQEIENRYKPMASEWQERKRMEAALPVIQKQLEDARTWPLFNESENEILDVLKSDPQISLDGAYRKVVFPKLIAERNTVRKDVIQELQKAPTATSVPTRVASKPNAAAGPRSLEDIIASEVEKLKR